MNTEKEINDLKEQMENIWLKHTLYNTTLFVLGVSVLTMYILSPDNIKMVGESMEAAGETVKETVKEAIHETLNKIEWDIMNQFIYVVDGRIIQIFNNPSLK